MYQYEKFIKKNNNNIVASNDLINTNYGFIYI